MRVVVVPAATPSAAALCCCAAAEAVFIIAATYGAGHLLCLYKAFAVIVAVVAIVNLFVQIFLCQRF